ncbi:hypothetical protein L3X38_036665 [Prunus dulcis]|uniref:Uncharacterized protein n=1 Tax=Prunus dulcis TaxID=3755 RepID=A0AAD4YQK3_PRUDU|nr:hypothetical protein L3X38_036665 [Prunus dulcis]
MLKKKGSERIDCMHYLHEGLPLQTYAYGPPKAFTKSQGSRFPRGASEHYDDMHHPPNKIVEDEYDYEEPEMFEHDPMNTTLTRTLEQMDNHWSTNR